MFHEGYLEEIKNTQYQLLNFLDDDENYEENYQNLNQILADQKIGDDQEELELFLQLLVKISNYHHRESNFYGKIERILLIFKEKITKYFTNSEIFNIFKSNKRILLFLIEEKMFIFDKNIVETIMQGKYLKYNYPSYFSPEIRPFLKNQNQNIDEQKDENFYENRKTGQNCSYVCQIIQKDLIKEFIVFRNRNNIQLNSTIEPSIYETNHFINKKEKITLIEYAAYSGSIQIFKYLLREKVELKPSLWLFAVYGENAEIIHILEDNKVMPIDITFCECLKESIKCQHNDLAVYIENNLLNNSDYENYKISDCFKYYNFSFFTNEIYNNNNDIYCLLCYACKYNYYRIVKDLLTRLTIDLNTTIVLNFIFFLIKFLIKKHPS